MTCRGQKHTRMHFLRPLKAREDESDDSPREGKLVSMACNKEGVMNWEVCMCVLGGGV